MSAGAGPLTALLLDARRHGNSHGRVIAVGRVDAQSNATSASESETNSLSLLASFAAGGRIGRCMRGVACLLVVTLCASVTPSKAEVSAGHTRAGNVLRFAIPATILGVELARGDREGAWQYAQVLGVAATATEVLKRTTHVERPDRSNDQSFPSGHATLALSAASYAHRRYGLQEAAPLYALATYVGYTRVQAGRHRWSDIAGSLALTSAASRWLVEPWSGAALALLPQLGHRGVAITVAATW